VLAIGGMSNDFGTKGVAEHAHFLDTRAQADRFRHKLLNAFFRANSQAANGDEDAKVRVCIVGGGATGVELAAELFNSAKCLQNYGLDLFDDNMLEIALLEAGPRILPALDEELARTAQSELEALGATVMSSTQVTEVAKGVVKTADGRVLEVDLIVWAAGVKGADLVKSMSDLEVTQRSLWVVSPTLQTTEDERIFAIGDCAQCVLPGDERPVPPRAQSAHQMANHVFSNICAMEITGHLSR
jgi:NADH dehydrogenase